MAMKEVLLFVSAILAVAAAYPYNDQANAAVALSCNNFAIYRTIIGSDTYELKGCMINNRLCVGGLPDGCGPIVGQCYDLYWYTGSFLWSSVICQNAFRSGHCYRPSKLPHHTYPLLNCNEARAQEEESQDVAEGVRICETDVNGVEHCRSLSDGINANAMEKESDCFCVRDSQGHKVCEPDNCDVGRATPFSSQ